MHVKIVGFKCHLDAQYDFDANAMILLKGPSGVGKSTILQAIYWCLYGSMKGISNNTGIMKKCSVTLQINQMIIHRQKGPVDLSITYPDPNGQEVTYKNDVAQQVINQTFGSKDLWKSCSYIEQKDRCSLLSGSGSERLALLNQLSFAQDDPKIYIERIDTELKAVNKQFTEKQAEFTAELNLFTQQLATRQAKFTLSESDILIIKNKISEQEKESERLYQEVLAHQRISGSYQTLKDQISNLNKVIPSESSYDISHYEKSNQQLNTEIQSLRNLLTDINHYTSIQQQLNTYNSQLLQKQQELSTVEKLISDLLMRINPNELKLSVTDQMIWQVSQQENQRQANLNDCSSLKCEYNLESIQQRITELHSVINKYQMLEMHKKTFSDLSALKNQLSTVQMSESLSDLENQKNNLMAEISELKKGLELLQCPSCLKSLRYINQNLILADGQPVNPQQINQKSVELTQIQNKINQFHHMNSLQNKISSLEQQLVNVTIFDQQIDIQQIKMDLSRLMKIQIIPLVTYDSATLRRIHEQNKLNQDHQLLLVKMDNLNHIITELQNKINEIRLPTVPSNNGQDILLSIKRSEDKLRTLNNEHQKYLQLQAEIAQANQGLTRLNSQLAEVEKLLKPNSQQEYQACLTLIKEFKTKLDDGMYGNMIVAKQKQLEIQRSEVMNLNQDLTTLQRLKQKAIEVECKQLQDTVDTINVSIEDMLPLFFNEPIVVLLQLYKTLKTKKETRPGLNIVIKYKGAEYDNINQLSGGEGDRISLALVLALNAVSNSPLILLDECVSSLDGPLKESCIEAMKTLQNKTIICVDHEGTEGFYDKTINIDN